MTSLELDFIKQFLKNVIFPIVSSPAAIGRIPRSPSAKATEAFFSEVKFKQTKFNRNDFTKVDFFRTPLKGIDFSDCIIENIMVSDSHQELRGMKIQMLQAVEIARMMEVEII